MATPSLPKQSMKVANQMREKTMTSSPDIKPNYKYKVYFLYHSLSSNLSGFYWGCGSLSSRTKIVRPQKSAWKLSRTAVCLCGISLKFRSFGDSPNDWHIDMYRHVHSHGIGDLLGQKCLPKRKNPAATSAIWRFGVGLSSLIHSVVPLQLAPAKLGFVDGWSC